MRAVSCLTVIIFRFFVHTFSKHVSMIQRHVSQYFMHDLSVSMGEERHEQRRRWTDGIGNKSDIR